MTIQSAFQKTATAALRNWHVLAVFGVILGVAFLTEPRWNTARIAGLAMIATGAVLNLLVVLANGGRMPAYIDSVPTGYSRDYQVMDAETRFAFLGDWIPVRESLVSPGDLCLSAGFAVWLASRLVGP